MKSLGHIQRLVAVLLVVSILPIAAASTYRSFSAVDNVFGRERDADYMARQLPADAGDDFAPPLEGIRALNLLLRTETRPCRVLIDTNLVAYADFPTVPVPYYIKVKAIEGRHWSRLPGPVCLNLSAKTVSDRELLDELTGRLNVRYILVKKTMPRPASPQGSPVQEPNLFLEFIHRWTREGVARESDLGDSILYTIEDCGREPSPEAPAPTIER